MNHFDRLKKMFIDAPINQIYNPEIKITQGFCFITMDVNPQHFHAAKALHGSVLFKMLDDSAFFAANSVETNYFVLTGTFTTKFLKPAIEGTITAEGQITSQNGRKILAKSMVKNQFGDPIATGEGIFIISSIKLSDLV